MTAVSDQAEGMVFIHSAPTALCSHIEWALDAAFGMPTGVEWQPQPVCPGQWRAEVPWRGAAPAAARLVSAMAAWGRLRFEVSVEAGAPARRWSVTPDLGVFSCLVDEAGSVLVDEMRLRAAMDAHRDDPVELAPALADLLGEPWDAELEAYRAGDPDLQVRWLDRRVG